MIVNASSLSFLLLLQSAQAAPTLSREQAEAFSAQEMAQHIQLHRYLPPDDVAAIERKFVPPDEVDEPLKFILLYSKPKPAVSFWPGVCVRMRYAFGLKMPSDADGTTQAPLQEMEKHGQVTIADQCDQETPQTQYVTIFQENEIGFSVPERTLLDAMVALKRWRDKAAAESWNAGAVPFFLDPYWRVEVADRNTVFANLSLNSIYRAELRGDEIDLYFASGIEKEAIAINPEYYTMVTLSVLDSEKPPIRWAMMTRAAGRNRVE